MVLDDLFVRELDGSFNFVSNRETGAWVLTEERDLSKLIELGPQKTISKKQSNGTAMTLLNVGRVCNLGCVYCHVGPDKTNEKMSIEVGKKAIDRVAELKEEDRLVIFHGSEPLVNYDLIKELVVYGQSRGVAKFGMQTNGTLIDDEKLAFFKDNNVGVGISIDGLEKHHDLTRPFLGGGPSYQVIMENVQKTIDVLGGVSVIAVVSDNNVHDLGDIVSDFENRGIGSVRFSPLYSSGEGVCRGPDPSTFASQMTRIYDAYIDDLIAGRGSIKVANFQETLRTVFSPKETFNCVKCSGGSRQPLMGVDIDGEIYPCDFFWGKGDYGVGNVEEKSIQEGLESSLNFRNYRDFSSLGECAPCDWKSYCGAGCPGSSVVSEGGILARDSYCEYTKAMFEYVVSKIPILYQQGLVQKVLND